MGVGVGVGVGCVGGRLRRARSARCPGAGFGVAGAVPVAPGVVAPGVVAVGSTGAGVTGVVGVVAGAWATGVPAGPFGPGSVMAA